MNADATVQDDCGTDVLRPALIILDTYETVYGCRAGGSPATTHLRSFAGNDWTDTEAYLTVRRSVAASPRGSCNSNTYAGRMEHALEISTSMVYRFAAQRLRS